MFRASTFILIVSLAGCFESEGPVSPDGESESWAEVEARFQARYFDSPIQVEGRLVDRNGGPVTDATVVMGELETKSFAGGRFEFTDVVRRNRTIKIEKSGFNVRLIPTHLLRSLDVESVDLGDILMESDEDSRLRFGGDVQLGRRYLDPDEQTPLDVIPAVHPNALISTADPEPGSKAVVEGIRELMQSADFTSINLETVVTDSPDEPAIGNSFVFFTLPGSLPALTWMGVDHVSLANNHIYDYAHGGVVDTIAHLNAAGIPYSGAGMNAQEAFRGYRARVEENNFSFISMVSIEGIPLRNSTGATDTRSGAADLNNDELILAAFQQELTDGYLPVGEIHTGYEYMESPPDDGYTRERMQAVVDAGAALVVSHHPHVPQGFEFHNDVLIAHSLGNLVFDQERLDVAYGAVLTTDFDATGTMSRAFVTPIYVEGFKAGLITPERGEWILRRIAYSSDRFGVDVHPELGRGIIARKNESWVKSERTVEVQSTDGVIDLRSIRLMGESLSGVDVEGSFEIGRDLLWFGDMEDQDVDASDEIDRWYYTGGGSFPCFHEAYRGAQAMCAVRNSAALSEVVIAFRHRMRVLGDKLNRPNKNLSLLGYSSADNAGPVRVVATYTASFKGMEFGDETIFERPAGTYDWEPFQASINLPDDDPSIVPEEGKPYDPKLRTDNARAVRIAIYMGRTEQAEGIVRFDDLAVVSWEDGETLSDVSGHNPFDFIRLSGEASSARVTFVSWERSAN